MQIEKWLTLKGWRRWILAAGFGICAMAALPPLYALPLIIPAFSGLFLLVTHARSRKQAFFDGWWWGLGYFTSGMYWTCTAFWLEPDKFAWLTPFALFGLPSVLGIYIGLVTLALKVTCGRWPVISGRKAVLLFAGLWIIVEYLRAYLFTGFPWNLIGYVWTISDATLQLASATGIYGLSWVAVIIGTMPALMVMKSADARRANLGALLLVAGMALFGVWRLESHPTLYSDVKVRIVQANIEQKLKWDMHSALEGLNKHVRLTQSAGLDKVNLVLWPETSVPYYIDPGSELAHDLGSMLPPDTLLITGGLRHSQQNRMDIWNSLYVIDAKGGIKATYDKHHLVPFGEYIPLRAIFPFPAVAAELGDFSRGPGAQTLTPGSYPAFSPLICYEAIFPDEATDDTHRARWLYNLTDDAWFGKSSEPYQALAMARVRGVEQGLPLMHVANTGISAAFDAYGRMLESLPLEKEGLLDLYLPLAADESIFSRYPQICILFLIAGTTGFLFLKRSNRHEPLE